jgi:hypothetical protein
MRHALFLILLGVALAVLIAARLLWGGPLAAPTVAEPTFKTVKYDFRETGNMARLHPELNGGRWFLIYEKPGAPALPVPLVFPETTKCLKHGVRVRSCLTLQLPDGARAHIEGYMKDGEVIVGTLTFLD